METKLLIIGKGDNIVTMVLDNLYSNGETPEIDIYNNMGLAVSNPFHHDSFKINILESVDLKSYQRYVMGVYKPEYKIRIIESLNPERSKFVNIIHKGLDISKMSELGIGVLINSKVSIAAHSKIGNFVSINRHVSIGHHTSIGDYCSINPGCNIAGRVKIGEGSTIGMGSNIIDGINIGKNTVIGAGSLVTKDIPDNVIAYGSPCKIIRKTFE
jgi:sugar O-acyltransferase (sialic acid O-acetyltransferase NeuD family)